MNVEKTLSIWSAACKNADIRWYLYRETLLCAAGYRHFPKTLTHPQVAVFAEDLSTLVQQVFPKLPQNWTLDKSDFGRNKHKLLFLEEGPVLELCVLYGAESEAQIDAFAEQVKQAVRKLNKKQFWNKLGNLIPVYAKAAGKRAQRRLDRLTDKTFDKLVALTQTPTGNAAVYSERLTNKESIVLPAAWFDSTVTLTCDQIDYPAFSGYRDYLDVVFCDYEAGLHDEIGCGLTEDGKAALKAHQKRCIEALAFLQKISQQFGLRYHLLAGSVLGCVRHGGFIPWDDDIDVGIRIEELEQFEAIVKEQLPRHLPEGFSLMQSGANNPYPRMFSKICYEGRCCIDLWPLVPTYGDGMRADFLWYFAKLITKVHLKKIGHPFVKFQKIATVMGAFLTDKMVMWLARRNERRYAFTDTPAYINLYSIYTRTKETIQRRWLDDPATAMFCGIEVPIVGCTEEYLTHLYGNYMEKPAPWKRASRHFARFYPIEATKKETEG